MEESNQQMMTPYKFSQCFGDKSENIEVADGKKRYYHYSNNSLSPL